MEACAPPPPCLRSISTEPYEPDHQRARRPETESRLRRRSGAAVVLVLIVGVVRAEAVMVRLLRRRRGGVVGRGFGRVCSSDAMVALAGGSLALVRLRCLGGAAGGAKPW